MEKLLNEHKIEEQKIHYEVKFLQGCKYYLPRSIHVARKLCILNKFAIVHALLHGLPRCEMVVCKVQYQ